MEQNQRDGKRIKLLNPQTSALLKAGMKLPTILECLSQLIEVAVNSAASSIEISIDLDKLILKVSDNGAGMDYNQLLNLEQSRVFAEMAQVGALIIKSKSRNAKIGYLKIYNDNNFTIPTECVFQKNGGAVVSFTNWFGKFPVRRKNIQSNQRLTRSAILKLVEKHMLIQLGITFILRDLVENKTLVKSTGNLSFRARITQVFGFSVSKSMEFIYFDFSGYSLQGFVSTIPLPTPFQILAVNKSLVESKKIVQFLSDITLASKYGQTYPTLLSERDIPLSKTSKKHISYVLLIECSKENFFWELGGSRKSVEFLHWDQVYKLLGLAIIKFLKRHSWIDGNQIPKLLTSLTVKKLDNKVPDTKKSLIKKAQSSSQFQILGNGVTSNAFIPKPSSSELNLLDQPSAGDLQIGYSGTYTEKKISIEDLYSSWTNPVFSSHTKNCQEKIPKYPLCYNIPRNIKNLQPQAAGIYTKSLEQAVVIGQLDRKFIICKLPSQNSNPTQPSSQIELIAVDQHAADERIKLEQNIESYYSTLCCIAKLSYDLYTNCKRSTKSEDDAILGQSLMDLSAEAIDFGKIKGICYMAEPTNLKFGLKESDLLITHLRTLKSWGFFIQVVEYSETRNGSNLLDDSQPVNPGDDDGLSLHVSNSRNEQSLCSRYYSVFRLTHIPEIFSNRIKRDKKVAKQLLTQLLPAVCSWFESCAQVNLEQNDFLPFANVQYLKEQGKPWLNMLRFCPPPLVVLIESIACRSAIKFNDFLTTSQSQHLISELLFCNFPFHCAHGRPSVVPLIKNERKRNIHKRRSINWERIVPLAD